ncbi:MAG: SBBP repeat-containing protein [Bacteroidales bacterium]|nr:SBBP repeat-containing protein [Bacteroidales bacterium]
MKQTKLVLFSICSVLFLYLNSGSPVNAQTISMILDGTGDGTGNVFEGTESVDGLAIDISGNVYVAGGTSNNAFRITPGGVITKIIDATGDGTGNILTECRDIAVDGSGNVYVVGRHSDNAFKITPGGVITEIIDATGDGQGNILNEPWGIEVDVFGNVYVAGWTSWNVFKITPSGVISEIHGKSSLRYPEGIAVDASGNVYVTSNNSNYDAHVLKITPGGVITKIIDANGDGAGHPLESAGNVDVDVAGNVYVTGKSTHNSFKITPDGVITQIIDATGDGTGNSYMKAVGLAVDCAGNVYVTGAKTCNAFKITPEGIISQIIDATGDGSGNNLPAPCGIDVDGFGNVYVMGTGTHPGKVFKISTANTPSGTISGVVSVNSIGIENILIRLLDKFGLPMDGFDDIYTDANGEYTFADVPPGSYQALIVDPLDYATDENPINTTVTANETSVVDFVMCLNMPVAIAKDITIELDENGIANITVSDIDNGSHDGCGIDSLTLTKTSFNCNDIGDNTVTLTVTNIYGKMASTEATVTVLNQSPTITVMEVPYDPINVGNQVHLTAYYEDNNLETAVWDWGDGTTMVEIDTDKIDGYHVYNLPGVYATILTITDMCGATTSYEHKYIVIYDPEGGFVTGGGWINSPESAYKPDLLLSGKANFGFVAKYKKGSTVPDGNTEFQFKAGDLNFQSVSYDDMRLVIAGARANFKGEGVINGIGNYGFMVSAIDGEINGGGGVDKFRIKIWDLSNNDEIVYDNNLIDTEDNAEPATAIEGGSIVIHNDKIKKSTEIESDIITPGEGSILLVYPNPFSESLYFEFVSPDDGYASIYLFDVYGRIRHTLFNSKVEGGIFYNVKFKPDIEMNNIFYYRMTIGESVYNGKVLYNK